MQLLLPVVVKTGLYLPFCCHFFHVSVLTGTPGCMMSLLFCQLHILPVQGIVLCLRSLVSAVLISLGPKRALRDAVGHSC